MMPRMNVLANLHQRGHGCSDMCKVPCLRYGAWRGGVNIRPAQCGPQHSSTIRFDLACYTCKRWQCQHGWLPAALKRLRHSCCNVGHLTDHTAFLIPT